MDAKPLTCARCKQAFHDQDHILFTGLSRYHEVPLPHGEEQHYAVGRVRAVLNVEHLVCEN